MTNNLFVIANVKQLRTGSSFRILRPFSPNISEFWRPKFSNFYSFHNRVEFGTILEGLRNFGGGGVWTPQPPPSVRHCVSENLVKSSFTCPVLRYVYLNFPAISQDVQINKCQWILQFLSTTYTKQLSAVTSEFSKYTRCLLRTPVLQLLLPPGVSIRSNSRKNG